MNQKLLIPVSVLTGVAVIFHVIPTIFRKPELEQPRSLKDLTKTK